MWKFKTNAIHSRIILYKVFPVNIYKTVKPLSEIIKPKKADFWKSPPAFFHEKDLQNITKIRTISFYIKKIHEILLSIYCINLLSFVNVSKQIFIC